MLLLLQVSLHHQGRNASIQDAIFEEVLLLPKLLRVEILNDLLEVFRRHFPFLIDVHIRDSVEELPPQRAADPLGIVEGDEQLELLLSLDISEVGLMALPGGARMSSLFVSLLEKSALRQHAVHRLQIA